MIERIDIQLKSIFERSDSSDSLARPVWYTWYYPLSLRGMGLTIPHKRQQIEDVTEYMPQTQVAISIIYINLTLHNTITNNIFFRIQNI